MNELKKMVVFSNWKIYMGSRQQVINYIEVLNNNLASFDDEILEVHIMTDFVSFEFVKKNLSTPGIKVGVQDLFWEDQGSFAGEVSPLMLRDLGCDSVYLGHSERKTYFCENDQNINKKILASLRNDIAPMMFVGETRQELEQGLTAQIIKNQLTAGLQGVTPEMLQKIIFIYEPRWAIGQKDSASSETIRVMHTLTRQILADIYSPGAVKNLRILYGGSVNEENIKAIMEIKEVDGVGAARASLDPLNFLKLIGIVQEEAKRRLR